ncbi:sensor histidine kinase [Rathayibacter soli]|uniref:sensor histidine kinase n=1 Tax=Rathayibacter soli TaxID=3144168 RepID=UPI0027E48002|nr:ATP-binding protein [Glaciibacter superstes]
MDSTALVLLSLALGLVVGAGFVALLHIAAGHGERAAGVVSPTVPDGVDAMLDAMDTAGVVLDPSNNIMKTSQAALALGIVWNGTMSHPELIQLVESVRRTGDPVTAEITLTRGPFGDASIYLRVRVARLGSRYVLLLAEDRTETYRVEAVRRDFVANVSHELKTPIAAVGLLTDALTVAADDPQAVRRFAELLAAESARLARITEDIIELSRLQATDAVANSRRVSIAEVVASAVDQNRVSAMAHGIELATGKSSDVEVFGNEALLVAAVHNLISNAIRYSPDRSRVGIGVRRADGVVEVSVTDQGDGIPSSDVDRVFERFYRVDQARSRETGGTGIGLAIVKHAIQNHGGDVRVWSQPGHGSTFTIRLPEADATTPVADMQGEQTL